MSLEMNVRKRLGDFTLDVRLQHPGGITGILGVSGCGKSLTLQMLAGVRTPDAGRIVLNGRVLFDSTAGVNLAPQKRHMGYLFQNYALFPTMTVAQNIACGIPRAVPRSQRMTHVREWMAKVQLDERLLSARPQQLSGGQQQRVALARALISCPEILLLDEPFSALDSYLRERMVTDVKEALRQGNGEALLVTHNRDEAYELCRNLAIMDHGRILDSGSVKDLFASPRTRMGAIVTGCKNIESAEKKGPCEIYVPKWNICLKTAMPVPDSVCAVGLRAHHLSPDVDENRHSIEIVEEIEEPFAWIIRFRYVGASRQSVPLWWRMSKDHPQSGLRTATALGISAQHVLTLEEE